jgi:hypothetical protein
LNLRRGASGGAPCILVVSCLLVAGCNATTSIETNKAADYNGSPQRLFVEEAFAPQASALRTPFQDRFDTVLRDCGVTPTFFLHVIQPAASLQLNPPGDPQITAMREAVARAGPDTLLSVAETAYATQGSSVRRVDFQLALTDVATRRQVWKARVSLGMGNSPDYVAGWDLANDVIKRLRDDGILRFCGQGGSAQAEPTAEPAPAPASPPASAQSKTITYKYGDQNYRTAADMLDARRADLAAKTSAVPQEPQPLRGRALIVLPTAETLVPLNAGTAKILSSFFNGSGPSSDVLVESNRIDLHALADAVVKARLFEDASVMEQVDTLAPSIGHADYLVWYRVRQTPEGGWVGEWMARPAGRHTPAPVSLPKDGAGQTPFYAAFVHNLRSVLEKQSASRN